MPYEWGDEEDIYTRNARAFAALRRQTFWDRVKAKGVRFGKCTTPPIKGSTFEEIAHKLIVETGGRTW